MPNLSTTLLRCHGNRWRHAGLSGWGHRWFTHLLCYWLAGKLHGAAMATDWSHAKGWGALAATATWEPSCQLPLSWLMTTWPQAVSLCDFQIKKDCDVCLSPFLRKDENIGIRGSSWKQGRSCYVLTKRQTRLGWIRASEKCSHNLLKYSYLHPELQLSMALHMRPVSPNTPAAADANAKDWCCKRIQPSGVMTTVSGRIIWISLPSICMEMLSVWDMDPSRCERLKRGFSHWPGLLFGYLNH